MKRLRSLVSLLLGAIVAISLAGCGSPEDTAPPTYSSEQVEQIQNYLPPICQVQERFPELEQAIEARRWSDVKSLIRGPFGQLRTDMASVQRRLLPRDREQAEELAERVFDDLERIDAAAKAADYSAAIRNYGRAEKDLDGFLDLVPQERPNA